MFNRKLEERVARLEKLVKGQKDTHAIGWSFGLAYEFGHPALPGLRDKVDAISAKLGLEYEKTPDTMGAWVAVDKRKTKVRKG